MTTAKPKPGMKRVIAHWTAGAGRASALDREHYHRLVEFDGTIVMGNEAIADNIVTSDGDYAAHTLGMNTASIGVAMCGMMNAVESPFDPGPVPLNEKQFRVFCIMVADLCREYGIAVTPETVLSHAEVEPNLGVKQRGKWDFSRLPWREDLRGARACGDYFRQLVKEALGYMPAAAIPQETRPTLQIGDEGQSVRDLQESLHIRGFFTGKIDGHFGTRTRAAVQELQANAGVKVDGVVGPKTWAALRETPKQQPRDVTAADLRKRNSTTVKNGDLGITTQQIATIGLPVGKVATDGIALIEKSQGIVDWAASLFERNWVFMVIIVGGALSWYLYSQIIAARVQAAVTGENLSK